MSEHADRDLVERARQGDSAAIAELFSRYWRAARAAAFGVTGEFASAEDAASEAFRQALAGMGSLRDPDRFGPWLRTIVVRQARLALQSRRRASDALADDLPDSNELPGHALERLELGALIQHAVRELPPRLREAVSLFYFEGYDSDDAARFLDIPAGTFRRRLHEGRRRLRSAAEQILQGSKPMNEEREREIERLKKLIDDADGGDTEPLYQALRQSLAIRPVPKELIYSVIGRQRETTLAPESIREMAQRFRPSSRVSDPNHPVGAVAAAIRQALPDFQDWPLDIADAAAHLFTFTGEPRDRLKAVLPPGFAEGRPGAFLHPTRALVHPSRTGAVQTTYELIQDSKDQQAFQAGMKGVRLSDVLDLTWMVAGPLELRSVQELLERLCAAVLPGASIRFASYDEPRYRSALQLQLGGDSTPAANGGVLAEWSGRPQGVEAALVRIFLEPWAAAQSGQVVDFEPLPAARETP